MLYIMQKRWYNLTVGGVYTDLFNFFKEVAMLALQYFGLIVASILILLGLIVLITLFLGLWFRLLTDNRKAWEEINTYNKGTKVKYNIQRWYYISVLAEIVLFLLAISCLIAAIVSMNIFYYVICLFLAVGAPLVYLYKLDSIKEYFRTRMWKAQFRNTKG